MRYFPYMASQYEKYTHIYIYMLKILRENRILETNRQWKNNTEMNVKQVVFAVS